MKTRFFVIITSLFMSSNVWAIDLIGVYKQALSSDPKFRSANSQWLADRETLAIQRGTLLPTLAASGSIARNRDEANSSIPTFSGGRSYNNQTAYKLQLTQPIFNFGNWASIWQAQAIAKKAEATFLAAAEDLLLRTSTAYFNVLQAEDILDFSIANREALGSTLNQAKHKYDVGLIAIVDLENARADYDKAIADEIAAQNDLADKHEQLNEITGIKYLCLDPLKQVFPLLSPQPTDIERWVKSAENQNFNLATARYATIVARENIKMVNAGHLPTLDANGSYQYVHNTNPSGGNFEGSDKTAQIGLTLNLPLFQGGQVLTKTKQANYQYQRALSDQETSHRSTISSTRQAYLGVLSNISKIKANKQAIKSAQSSLRATKASYEAGTRTMVDVLQAQAKLYSTQKDYAATEYAYINQLLTLKQLTGILDAGDLRQINTWLEKQKVETENGTVSKSKHKIKKRTSVTKKTKSAQINPNATEAIVESPVVAAIPEKEQQPDTTNLGSDTKIDSTKPDANVTTTTTNSDNPELMQ